MGVRENLESLKSEIPEYVTLVAVSKTKPEEKILEAYREGHLDFGENRVQDLARKYENLPRDIRWHMIGHLQTNKVKYLAPFIHMIHGVDSLKLLSAINKEGAKNKRIIDCLLQIHIAEEETKSGFHEDGLKDLISSGEFSEMKNVRIRGLMGMASYTENQEQIRGEFQFLKSLFEKLEKTHFAGQKSFDQLSAGMSGDYSIAIDQGSTMIRVGSLIFGSRVL